MGPSRFQLRPHDSGVGTCHCASSTVMIHTSLSRREMLAALAAAGLGPFAFSRVAFTRIGLQLYTLRRVITQDVDGTLSAVARMGYKEVETAGYANKTPAD